MSRGDQGPCGPPIRVVIRFALRGVAARRNLPVPLASRGSQGNALAVALTAAAQLPSAPADNKSLLP